MSESSVWVPCWKKLFFILDSFIALLTLFGCFVLKFLSVSLIVTLVKNKNVEDH